MFRTIRHTRWLAAGSALAGALLTSLAARAQDSPRPASPAPSPGPALTQTPAPAAAPATPGPLAAPAPAPATPPSAAPLPSGTTPVQLRLSVPALPDAAGAPSAPAPTSAVPAAPPPAVSPATTAASNWEAGLAAAEAGLPYAARDSVARWASEVAQRRGLSAPWVRATLAQAVVQPSVQRLIMPGAPGTRRNWAAYRARYLDPVRINAGVAFWETHRETIARAEAQWGVPAEILVGIIGVETVYGRVTGNFRVLDALATLAFDFPGGRSDRSPFFRSELEEFLVWTARESLDPTAIKGSYAGALGLPQFMPGSLNRHAVDFDGDGHIDLLGSPADAIGSVANFLINHGWTPGQPTHFESSGPPTPEDRAVLLARDILPTLTVDELGERGVVVSRAAMAHPGKLALIEWENGFAPPSYAVGTGNFYAITRYNWSSYYAMAVIELGRSVAAVRSGQDSALQIGRAAEAAARATRQPGG